MGMYEVYEDWFGNDGFYPFESDSEDCSNWQEYSRKLGCIEVTVDDIRRTQAKEEAKRSNGWHTDEKVREHLAKIGYYKRWYRSLMRKLRRQA
jgi:hypothetical protein